MMNIMIKVGGVSKKRGLRAQTRPVGSVRARPLVSVRTCHITLVYSLLFEHITLHWYTL